MYQFKLEAGNALLIATRTGLWTCDTVRAYEVALREQLALLQKCGSPTSFIIDIRSSAAQPKEVVEALRAMVAGLGALHVERSAVVATLGFSKLQAGRVADPDVRVFTSLVLARDWLLGIPARKSAQDKIYSEPSTAKTVGPSVHVQGPSGVDVKFTPAAAFLTAKRIQTAATEALRNRTGSSLTAFRPKSAAS